MCIQYTSYIQWKYCCILGISWGQNVSPSKWRFDWEKRGYNTQEMRTLLGYLNFMGTMLSIYLSIHPSIYLAIYLSLFIHISIGQYPPMDIGTTLEFETQDVLRFFLLRFPGKDEGVLSISDKQSGRIISNKKQMDISRFKWEASENWLCLIICH